MGELINFIGEILVWLLDAAFWVIHEAYKLLLEGLLHVLNSIPVPDFLTGPSPFASLDPGIVFFLEPLNLEQVIAILITALICRFVIRRIPVVG